MSLTLSQRTITSNRYDSYVCSDSYNLIFIFIHMYKRAPLSRCLRASKVREFENVYRSDFCFDGGATRRRGRGNVLGGTERVQRENGWGWLREDGGASAKPIERPDVITAGNWTNGKCILLLRQPSPKRRTGITSSSLFLLPFSYSLSFFLTVSV